MADLNVTIGADATQYNQAMAGVAQTAQSTATNVTRSLAQAAAAAQTSGSAIARSSGQASSALVNLGRVAQDAPFGFIGIANNLNPLLESFQRLRNESGSTGGALRALGQSLIGGGGLGIALSAFQAAVLFAQLGLSRWSTATKDAKKAALEYAETLDSVRQAQLKGQQTGESEIVRLRILYQATQNHSLSIRDRNLAYDELDAKYPKFFSNADREKTLLGQNIESYNKLAFAILAAANAKAYEQKIGENSNRIFENVQKGNDELAKQVKLQADIIRLRAQSQPTGSSDITAGQDAPSLVELAKAQSALQDSYQKVRDLNSDTAKLNKQNSDLQKLASSAELAAQFKTAGELDDKNKKLAAQKTLLEQLEAQLKNLQDAENKWIETGNKGDPFNLTKRERDINALIVKIDALKKSTAELFIPQVKGTNSTGDFISNSVGNAASSGLNAAGIVNPTFGNADDLKSMQNTIAALEKTNELRGKAYTDQQKFNESLKITTQVSRVFGQGLTNAFQSVLTGGQNFISAMGKFLGDLITRLIAAAAAAALLAVILSAVGFGTGFAGAATEAGSFKSLFGSFSGLKLASGGITQGPTQALIGEGKENEVVMPLSKLDQYVNGGGNGGSDKWETRTVLRGADLYTQIRRANKQNSRLS